VLTALAYLVGGPAEAFTAYDCTNRSNVVEAYSLLEPDACASLGRDGEVETTVFGEIVQIKQDRMISVFRCIVIETLVAQYCGMFSAAGVTRYLKFRSSSRWRPGSAERHRGPDSCSSTGGPWRGRWGLPCPTPCSCPGTSTIAATARWAW
jgi:hypothetical protein